MAVFKTQLVSNAAVKRRTVLIWAWKISSVEIVWVLCD